MKVSEFIESLQRFDGDLEVVITDGLRQECYDTAEIYFSLFYNPPENNVVDIGIVHDSCKRHKQHI